MAHPFEDDVVAGLAGIELPADPYDLGQGITIKPTYAHLIGTYMVAFSPAPPGQHHPAPWKAARAGFGADITAELHIPKATLSLSMNKRLDLVQLLVALLRLWATPSVTAPILSNIPFANAKEAPNNEAYLWPYESRAFEYPFGSVGKAVTAGSIDWVRDHWQDAFALTSSSTAFRTAVFALDQTQFLKDRALTLISFWAALEGLFLTNAQELRFRLAAFVASYLEEPGAERMTRYKKIVGLYDHRSKAAHGKPKNDPKALGESFDLLREVVIRIIVDKHIPTNEELEARLLGSSLSTLLC
jgi:hypothetical protein